MKIYYAHPITTYDSIIEQKDLLLLKALGFEVVNPNSKESDINYRALGMSYFESVVASCDALAFRALPDGSIPAGIAKEIDAANHYSKPIFELPTRVRRRVLSVDATREYLLETGRKS
jgi:hypothetical protein